VAVFAEREPSVSRFSTILGAGSALWDILAHVSEDTLASLGQPKGGMTLMDAQDHTDLFSRLDGKLSGVEEAAGGSASNTMLGLARLGSKAAFIGRRGADARGELLEKTLQGHGVETRLAVDTTPNGCVLSLVTPDAQRTMFTSLAAASNFCAADVHALDLQGVGLLYLEGYLLFNPPVFDALMDRAQAAKIPVAFDCGAFSVVEACKGRLQELLSQGRIEILLANEDEAYALTGAHDEAALEWIASHVPTAVVKLGARGALLAQGGKRAIVSAAPVAHVLDTTAAGDIWAAGFLHGLDKGLDLAAAGHLAAKAAAEVIQVMGTAIPEERWAALKAVA
jgi:sugar/nucleoside kinase (ribokinase family)